MKNNSIKHKDSELNQKSVSRELVLDKNNLPLNIVYKGRRYVLLLTKNDKLILNKNTD